MLFPLLSVFSLLFCFCDFAKNGKTALDLARKQGHTEIVALLEVIVSRIFLLVFPLHLVQPLKSSSQAFKSVPAPQPRHQPQSSLRLSLML
eukprot:m.402996 g.402996  ORF g.402996 m.402996 type:complete len:91 (-) comp56460_c0_seq4:399-671(-)